MRFILEVLEQELITCYLCQDWFGQLHSQSGVVNYAT